MGFFKNLLLGAAAAKTYQNVYNRPNVIPPPGYVIRGMKQNGVGSVSALLMSSGCLSFVWLCCCQVVDLSGCVARS